VKHLFIPNLWALLVLVGVVLGDQEPAGDKIDDLLLALHRHEATRWEIFVDPDRAKKAEFVPEPVFRWTNLARANVQYEGKEVWTSLRDDATGPFGNPDNTFGLIRDRLIDELPEIRKRAE
jgi:hypothetical protein